MDSRLKPFYAGSDELHLASLVLRALEIGRLRMDADDYRAVSREAGELLDEYDTAVLMRLRREGPTALREIAENLLDNRGAFDSIAHDPARERAMLLTDLLIAGLMIDRRSTRRR